MNVGMCVLMQSKTKDNKAFCISLEILCQVDIC